MDAQVLIIGGGIAGLSLAWRLAPARSVVVVEAEASLAFHSSSRSARQMQPSYGPAPHPGTDPAQHRHGGGRFPPRLAAPILKPRPLITLGTVAEVAGLLASHPQLQRVDHAETLR